VVSNVVTLVSSVVAMLVLSPLLTGISLAATPVFVVFSRRVGRARRRARRDAQASLAAMGSITQETLSVSGILLAKVFGRQEHEVGRYRAENAPRPTCRSGRRSPADRSSRSPKGLGTTSIRCLTGAALRGEAAPPSAGFSGAIQPSGGGRLRGRLGVRSPVMSPSLSPVACLVAAGRLI
jgi:ABC transporter transmembrane region